MNFTYEFLFLTNACSGFFMTGLIWFVQVIHYPSFKEQGTDHFHHLHHLHVLRTGFVVIPVMLAELGTSVVLSTYDSELFLIDRIGLGLVILIWLSTFLLQVPIHNKLRKSFEIRLITRLVRTNWIRTMLWSVKALLSFYGLFYYLTNTIT